MSSPLSRTLLEAVPVALRDSLAGVPDLEAKLESLVGRAQRAWPQLENDPERFMAHLGAVASGHDGEAWLQRLRPDDLWLALSCASGHAGSVEAFEEQYATDLRRAVARFASATNPADDLLQILRDKLFVGEAGGAPKIASYSGAGFLQNWLRITAVRTFVDVTRAKRSPTPDTPLAQAYAAAGDFEVDFLKQRYRSEFKGAFAEAMAALDATSRNLLRYRVRGLSVDRIAAVEGVHRATAARRVAKAREELLAQTRARLGDRLLVQASELDSIMRLINSRLDVSIERLLRAPDARRDER